MSAVPLFPTGLVKQYKAPKIFLNEIDFSEFEFHLFPGQTKLRSDKFTNILTAPQFAEVRKFVEESACDFLDNEMQIEYEEFFLTDSWLNISQKGGYQKVHNHSNSIVSGTLYLKSVPEHVITSLA